MKKQLALLLLGIMILRPLTGFSQPGATAVDDLTLQNIAQALWFKNYNRDSVPKDILDKVEQKKNSNQEFARRYVAYIEHLKSNKMSYVPSSDERYDQITRHATSLSPQQCYATARLLGPESVNGYTPVPLDPRFQFPEIDAPQLDYQVGWHFFVGNFTDNENRHYCIQFMLWQYALLPPPLAKKLGLSDIENQTLEMHLAVSDPAAGIHYRANTVVVAGTTGLISFTQNPFNYKLGNNSIQSLNQSARLFPCRIRARGWDMGKSPVVQIELDLSLENNKGYFMQGDGGCSPSIDGLGTLYYSAPLLKLVKDGANVIRINGKEVKLSGGSMWYDHQWATGFMPDGAPQHASMRAARNLSEPAPGGWDWFMFQFHDKPATGISGEAQMTLYALHSNGNKQFYWQNGPEPPGKMEAVFTGKYIDPSNKTFPVAGKMVVDQWVKSASSPNPEIYPATNNWYPAGYKFYILGDLPMVLKQLSVKPIIKTGQFGFFSNGLEYDEGGATVCDSTGNEIGRGFAESTNYADCNKILLKLTGLPVNDETLSFLKPPKVTGWLKFRSFNYVLFHKKEIKEIMGKARGFAAQ